MTKVMVMVDRPIPSDHSFLQGCIGNYLGEVFDLSWVGPAHKEQKCSKEDFAIRSNGRLKLYLSFLFVLPKLIMYIHKEKIRVLYVRNDPVFALFAIVLGSFIPVRFIYQLSHLKEEQILQKWNGSYLFSMGSRFFARVSRLLRDFVIARADLFIPISQSMLDELSYLKFRDVKVMGLGFDPTEFTGPPAGEFQFPYIIYVGTLDPIRNFELTLRGFVKYIESCRDSNLRLLVVGGEELDSDRKRCLEYARYLGIEDQVIFINRMPRLEMIGVIKGALAGISIIPPVGINKTISPTKLFEYIGAGIPIIVSSGIPAQDEVASFYTSSYWADDEQQIAQAISQCVMDGKNNVAAPLSESASRYSYAHMASELISYIGR